MTASLVTCPRCNGRGEIGRQSARVVVFEIVPPEPIPCTVCGGEGEMPSDLEEQYQIREGHVTWCDRCNRYVYCTFVQNPETGDIEELCGRCQHPELYIRPATDKSKSELEEIA